MGAAGPPRPTIGGIEFARFILGEAPLPPPPANAVFIKGDTTPAARAGGLGFYWQQITEGSSDPIWSTDTATSDGVTPTGHAWTPAASVTPEYDFNGNLTHDGRWDYTWDAENRRTSMQTTPTAANDAGVPRQRLDFVYDSQGRRISKTVTTSPDGTTWTLASTRRFLYDGWNLIAEYSAPSETSTTLTLEASYLWVLDLSGTMQGAGGVGGLLAVAPITNKPITNNYPSYDGNANISAWIGGTGALLARMDYSPFGQLIARYKFTSDTILSRLPFGYSTKYTDPETGLLYYGHRYYNPVNGKWQSRDPIGEWGGVNLYGFVGNDGVDHLDRLGMWKADVHQDLTTKWADELGIDHWNASITIGLSNNRIDTMYCPIFITEENWSWHFNRSRPGHSDSRMIHATEQMERAKRDCTDPTDNANEAAKSLGMGLHALQDIVAHGDFNRFSETPNASRNVGPQSASYTHNSVAPGLGTGDFPDNTGLDSDGPNGTVVFDNMIQGGRLWTNGDLLYYANFKPGNRRLNKTRDDTKQYLQHFQQYVRDYAKPCGQCRKAFVGGREAVLLAS